MVLLFVIQSSPSYGVGGDDKIDYGESTVTFEDVLRNPESYIGSEFPLTGYFMNKGSAKIYATIEAINNPRLGRLTLDVGDFKGKVSDYDGCYVSIRGTLRKVHENSDVYVFTNIKEISRLGLLYFTAKDRMNRTGLDKPPKCLVEALIEIMSEGVSE